MRRLRRSLSLTPKDSAKLCTSLYEDTFPGDPPEVGEYPVRGNLELPEHMRRQALSERVPHVTHRPISETKPPGAPQSSGGLKSTHGSSHPNTADLTPRATSLEGNRQLSAPFPADTTSTRGRAGLRADEFALQGRNRQLRGQPEIVASNSEMSMDWLTDSEHLHDQQPSPQSDRTRQSPQQVGQYAPGRAPDVPTTAESSRPKIAAHRMDSEDIYRRPVIKPDDLASDQFGYLSRIYRPKGLKAELPERGPKIAVGTSHARTNDQEGLHSTRIGQAVSTSPTGSFPGQIGTTSERSGIASSDETIMKRASHDDKQRLASITRKKVGGGTSHPDPQYVSGLGPSNGSESPLDGYVRNQVSPQADSLGHRPTMFQESMPFRQRYYDDGQRAAPIARSDHRRPTEEGDLVTTKLHEPQEQHRGDSREECTEISEKPSLQGIVDPTNTVDTKVITTQAPAVVHGGLKEVDASDIPGRAKHSQIVETVTPERNAPHRANLEPLPGQESIMLSTEKPTSPECIPRTVTHWKHAPTLETGARDTGQTWPFKMDSVQPPSFGTSGAEMQSRRSTDLDGSAPIQSRISGARTASISTSSQRAGPRAGSINAEPSTSSTIPSPRPSSPPVLRAAHGDSGQPASRRSTNLRERESPLLPGQVPGQALTGISGAQSLKSGSISRKPLIDKPVPSLPNGANLERDISQGRFGHTATFQAPSGSDPPSLGSILEASAVSKDPSSSVATATSFREDQMVGSAEDDSRSSSPRTLAPVQRNSDIRPRSRDYSRMTMPPQDYYPAFAGAATQDARHNSNSCSVADTHQFPDDHDVASSCEASGMTPSEDRASFVSAASQRSPGITAQAQATEHGAALRNSSPSMTSSGEGASDSRLSSGPISSRTPTATTGLPSSSSGDFASQGPGSIQSYSQRGGSASNQPVIDAVDNEGLIPVDLHSVGGSVSGHEVQGLIPAEQPQAHRVPEKNVSSWKMLRSNNPLSVDPKRPRIRDFAKNYIKSIAGTSADTPGPNTVPGAFPGAPRDPAM